MPKKEDTDVLHKAGTHPDWSESFYFNFYDKGNDLLAFMRIGLKPNKGEKNIFCGMIMPDGTVLATKSDIKSSGSDLSAGGLAFTKEVPEKLWRLSFDGQLFKSDRGKPVPEHVSFEITFDSLNEIFNYRDCVSGYKEQISSRVASEHLEQFGRARGTIVVGGKALSIDGLGERDHSWGIRDWNAPLMWIWITCQFSEIHALNVTKLVVEEGEVDAGFVHYGGRNVPIKSAKVSTAFAQDGAPESLEMALEDADGKVHRLSGIVLKMATLPFKSSDSARLSTLYEPLARFAMGGEVGYGIAEYLVRKS
uniref:Uncharacterized protein n=1 Tax=Candidatus Methanomethylicus mesodigestus TaxID=1867258 RepID=A0A7C3ETP2_9CREN